jgi:signal transduction histidine kinase
LSRKFEGSGLGLLLCKAIVEMHGGEINLMSTPGSGTTASVFLRPCAATRPKATDCPSAAA